MVTEFLGQLDSALEKMLKLQAPQLTSTVRLTVGEQIAF